jgi:hypothetical protein
VSNEPKKVSDLPFSAPVRRNPAQTPKKGKSPIKAPSNRQQLRKAKKNPKSAISVRSLMAGLFILIATSVAVTAVISPSVLTKIVAGEFVETSDTCTVIELNSTIFFDTTCGKFEWNAERQPGTPSAHLVEGETYTFTSIGIRVEPARVFPSMLTYEKAVAVAE